MSRRCPCGTPVGPQGRLCAICAAVNVFASALKQQRRRRLPGTRERDEDALHCEWRQLEEIQHELCGPQSNIGSSLGGACGRTREGQRIVLSVMAHTFRTPLRINRR